MILFQVINAYRLFLVIFLNIKNILKKVTEKINEEEDGSKREERRIRITMMMSIWSYVKSSSQNIPSTTNDYGWDLSNKFALKKYYLLTRFQSDPRKNNSKTQ